MKIINLTPHTINVNSLAVEPSGMVARVSVTTEVIGEIGGIEIRRSAYGEIEGMPEFEDDTIYLVSALVLGRCPAEWAGRVFAPDTGPSAVRNDKGHIAYVTGLIGL